MLVPIIRFPRPTAEIDHRQRDPSTVGVGNVASQLGKLPQGCVLSHNTVHSPFQRNNAHPSVGCSELHAPLRHSDVRSSAIYAGLELDSFFVAA